MQAVPADELDRAFEAACVGSITLVFGRAISFAGHGILLPCISDEEPFAAFRARLLGTPQTRREAPHITLAHPRNPKAQGNDLAVAQQHPAQIEITFSEACLIEQTNGEKWRVLRRFRLAQQRAQCRE